MRRTTVVLTLLVVALTVSLGAPYPAAAQDNGVIEGRLVNGTAGGEAPADVPVTVHIVQNRAKIGERVLRTDGAGRFRAEGLSTATDTFYFPIAQYRGVSYFPAQPVMLTGATPVPVEIQVYEATPTPDQLAYDKANMLLLNVSPTALTVMEMGAVVNAGDRTFAADAQVTGSARTLRFSLPTGATDVTAQAGLPDDTLEQTLDGFATTDPVRPGRREIAYSYQLPYESSSLDLSRSFPIPVGTFTLYVPGDSVDVIGPGLVLQGTAELGGQRFRQYAVQNVAPGAEVRFRLSGLPAPLFARPRDLGLAVAGAGTLALVVFLTLAVRRRRATQATESGQATLASRLPTQAQPSLERLGLIREVAELDERFEAGGLDEAAYRAEREAKKARLLMLPDGSVPTR